jgi:hypothetical protein
VANIIQLIWSGIQNNCGWHTTWERQSRDGSEWRTDTHRGCGSVRSCHRISYYKVIWDARKGASPIRIHLRCVHLIRVHLQLRENLRHTLRMCVFDLIVPEATVAQIGDTLRANQRRVARARVANLVDIWGHCSTNRDTPYLTYVSCLMPPWPS